MRTVKSLQQILKIFKHGLTRETLKKDIRRERKERRLKVQGFVSKTGILLRKLFLSISAGSCPAVGDYLREGSGWPPTLLLRGSTKHSNISWKLVVNTNAVDCSGDFLPDGLCLIPLFRLRNFILLLFSCFVFREVPLFAVFRTLVFWSLEARRTKPSINTGVNLK